VPRSILLPLTLSQSLYLSRIYNRRW